MKTLPQKSGDAKFSLTRVVFFTLLIGTLIAVNLGAALYLLYLKPRAISHDPKPPSAIASPKSKVGG